MPTIVSRSAWGFPGWLKGVTPTSTPASTRTEFMVHYEGGDPVGGSVGPGVARAINAYHQLGNGWAGIGYNFVVDQAGAIFEGRGWDEVGAHCYAHNWQAIGVQIHIGDGETPTDAALSSTVWLYEQACARAGHSLKRMGHRDGFATLCPGTNLYAWVRAGMPAPRAQGAPSVPLTPKPAVTIIEEEDTMQVINVTTKAGAAPYGQAAITGAGWTMLGNPSESRACASYVHELNRDPGADAMMSDDELAQVATVFVRIARVSRGLAP